MNPRNPRFIDVEPTLNDAGCYTTPAGDIEPGTVEYVIDLLSSTIDNPNNTVSKGKLKHIAAQLLARNVVIEKQNRALQIKVRELELANKLTLSKITSVTISEANMTEEQKRTFTEILSTGASLSRGTMTPGTLA